VNSGPPPGRYPQHAAPPVRDQYPPQPDPYPAQQPYAQRDGYESQQRYAPRDGYESQEPYAPRDRYESHQRYAPQRDRYEPEREPSSESYSGASYDEPSFRLRLPGLGLLFAIAGLAVQAVSLFLLPWITAGQQSLSAGDLWEAASNAGAHGVGGWYLFLFSYPLAALSVVLTLAALFESAAMKVVWLGLTLLGCGYLAIRHGVGPLVHTVGEGGELSRPDIVIGLVAVAVIVFVAFLFKIAVSTFRRIAALILLVLAGVHLYAVTDLTGTSDVAELSFGAFGPALGYGLCALAALLPKRLPGI